MGRDAIGFCGIGCLAFLIGIAWNAVGMSAHWWPYRTPGERTAALRGENEGMRVAADISFSELAATLIQGRIRLIDAREAQEYEDGHLPGAVNLSPGEASSDPDATLDQLLEEKQAAVVVVYCSSVMCDDANRVADELLRAGMKNVRVYRGGWREWTENGGEVER